MNDNFGSCVENEENKFQELLLCGDQYAISKQQEETVS